MSDRGKEGIRFDQDTRWVWRGPHPQLVSVAWLDPGFHYSGQNSHNIIHFFFKLLLTFFFLISSRVIVSEHLFSSTVLGMFTDKTILPNKNRMYL